MVDPVKPSTTARAAQGDSAPWSTFYDEVDLPSDLRSPQDARTYRNMRMDAQITSLLKAPMKDAEVATALDVSTAQAKAWLQHLVDEGVIEKQKKPAGYIVKQSSLFE